MLENLKEEVLKVNLELFKKKLIIYIWGNVSGIDREKGLVVIKLSGVEYSNMIVEDMVVVDLEGNIVDGKLRFFLDILIYLVLYKEFEELGGIVYIYLSWVIIWV